MNKVNVVVIGGGHGQAVILRGLKNIRNINLSTIVTVADDGGSTGRLRSYMQMPAVGDIRNVMIALSEEESLLTELMDYRFAGEDETDIAGHNLGNLMLTALTQKKGNLVEAIEKLGKVLRVKGHIIPATTQVVTLCARMEDDTIVRGESNIPKYFNHISEVYYQEDVTGAKSAVEAIHSADLILFGIGSIYTSICPNLIIPEIRDAILASKAKRVYICNAMSQHGETDNYTLEDHVEAIEKHLQGKIDTVVRADDLLPKNILKLYEAEYAYPVLMEKEEHEYEVISTSLLNFERNLIRHDSDKIQNVVEIIIKRDIVL